VKFGVGRYLYRDGIPEFVTKDSGLRTQDSVQNSMEPAAEASRPPESRVPSPESSEPRAPKSGRALFAWTKEQEQRHEVGLLKYLNRWAKFQEFPGRMVDWDADQVSQAYAEAIRKLQSIDKGAAEVREEALAN
jgi:hypothetical protein